MSRAFRIASPCVRPAVLDATWAATGYGLGGKPAITNIAAMGDSITGGISGSTTETRNYGGYIGYALTVLENRLTLVRSSANTNFQTGGFTVQQIIDTWLPQVITAAPDCCVVHCGTNSLNDSLAPAAGNGNTDAAAAWIFAQLATIMTGLRDAGIKCVICTITPEAYTDGTFTADMRTTRKKTNDLIRANARTYGAVLCDWSLVNSTSTTDETALANTNYLTDFIHPNRVGYWRLGSFLAGVIAENFALPEYALPDSSSALWATGNPYMTGDTAGLATGWSISAGSLTVARSKTAEGWQRLTCANGVNPGASNTSWTINRNIDVTDNRFDGKLYRLLADIRPISATWEIWAIQASITCQNITTSTTRISYLPAFYGTSDTAKELAVAPVNPRLVFATAPIQHPGGTSTNQRRINVTVRVWGRGGFDIATLGAVEVP